MMQLVELPRQGEDTVAGISTCQDRQFTQLVHNEKSTLR